MVNYSVQWIAGLEGTVAGLCFKVRKLFYLSTEHLPNKNTIWALEVNWFKAVLNYKANVMKWVPLNVFSQTL